MTSTVRVSEIKRGRSRRLKTHDGKPKQGSKLRVDYDALRRGEIVSFVGNTKAHRRQLEDYYGMDIEVVRTPGGKAIGSRLVGEWDGPYYVPVERIASEEAESV